MSSSDLLVAGGQRLEPCVCSSTVLLLLLLQWLSSELPDTLAAAAAGAPQTHTIALDEILKISSYFRKCMFMTSFLQFTVVPLEPRRFQQTGLSA